MTNYNLFNIVFKYRKNKEVWHGVNPWGESSHLNCDGWNTDNGLQVIMYSSVKVHEKWLALLSLGSH